MHFRVSFRSQTVVALAIVSFLAAGGATTNAIRKGVAHAQQAGGTQKPNILVIMGDDIGWYNPSIYNRGDMGYQTPNIDRIGKEGAMFLSWYAQQSCTAGRAAFLTGQSPIRTGMTKVRTPQPDQGLPSTDPTVPEA